MHFVLIISSLANNLSPSLIEAISQLLIHLRTVLTTAPACNFSPRKKWVHYLHSNSIHRIFNWEVTFILLSIHWMTQALVYISIHLPARTACLVRKHCSIFTLQNVLENRWLLPLSFIKSTHVVMAQLWGRNISTSYKQLKQVHHSL